MRRRSLIIINCLCLGIIVLALAVRISRALPFSDPRHQAYNAWKALFPDANFYAPDKVKPAPKSAGPTITAKAYLVGNIASGKVYIEQNSAAALPVASMSKLITAIAATDTMEPGAEVGITAEETDVASDTARLSAGETFTVRELLYPLLLDSSNVAAEALASSSDRVKFLELMSSYAWEVGMPSTFFADPSGINPRNISTARDFFNLAKYLYRSKPDILALTRTIRADTGTTSEHGAHDFVNIHPFVTDPNFLGGKTGHTVAAGDTMLTIMKINGQPIAVVVLASENRKADTKLLLDRIRATVAER
ncbi:MAG: hypothetical protein QOG91_62 [Candidatus Parcubacteria bacterium]|jgi:D-alanyl-D-alanine endopeptidase (penicillin-binding protein 7)|nr:hypothetical protein [Candidatus Parcubacteria bacterium]